MPKLTCALLLVCFVWPATVFANDDAQRFARNFSNVHRSFMSGDCDGFSANLKIDHSHVSGWFFVAEGSCRGARSRVSAAFYNRISKEISFSTVGESKQTTIVKFKGVLSETELKGELAYINPVTGGLQPIGAVVLKRLSQKLSTKKSIN